MTKYRIAPLLALLAVFILAMTQTTASHADGLFEGGVIPSVEGITTGAATNVGFQQTYSSTPLVFVLANNIGSDPAAIRIRNVTTSGFDAVLVEPNNRDGTHSDMTGVSYIAVMPGRYTLPNGTVLEAGTHSTTTTVQNSAAFPSAGGHDSVTFSSAFTAQPALLADIQTMVNETAPTLPGNASSPWLTTSINSDSGGTNGSSISTTGFDVALERAQVNDGGTVTQAETIGYLAITKGHGNIATAGGFVVSGGSVEFDADISTDSITGWDNTAPDGSGDSVAFNSPFTSAPEVVVASQATRDGSDGGWLRVNPAGPSPLTNVSLALDEDDFNDAERNHTAERASIVAFGNAFTASVTTQEVFWDNGDPTNSAGATGGPGNQLWRDNVNWRNNNTDPQNAPPNNVLPGINDVVNIGLNNDVPGSGSSQFTPVRIEAGDSFEVDSVRIGTNPGLSVGGHGTLQIDGGELIIRNHAPDPTVAVGLGTQPGRGTLNLGADSNRTGTVDITSGGNLDVGGAIILGLENGTTGILNVTDGTLIAGGGINIAGNDTADNGAAGTLTVGDGTTTGSVTVSGGNTEVGRGGTGSLIVNGGTFTQESNNLVLAQDVDSQGTVTLNSGTINVGDGGVVNSDLNFNSGTSLFDHKGGDVDVERNIQMANNNAAADATYNLDAGTGSLTIGGQLFVGRDGKGTFNFESGGFSIGQEIYVGGSSSTNGNAHPNADGTINIGTLGGAPTMNTNQFEVGRHNIGVVNQDDGTVNVNGGNLVIGQYANSDGTYNLNDGVVDVQNLLNIGNQGKGTFIQNDGDLRVGGQLALANLAGTADATFIMNGGQLSVGDVVNSNIVIGDFNNAGASARVEIRDGSVTVSHAIRIASTGGNSSGTLIVGRADGSTSPTITLQSLGGTGDSNFETAVNGTGTFTFHSGTIDLESNNLITGQNVGSVANVQVGGGAGTATLNLNGTGSLGDWNTNGGNGIVNVLSNGTINVNHDINLGGNPDANSGLELTINGGTVRVGLNGAGNIDFRNDGPRDQINLRGGTLDLTASNDPATGSVLFADADASQFSFTGGTLIDVNTFGNSLTQSSMDNPSRFVIGIEGDTARPADGSTTTITGDYDLVGGSLIVDIFGDNSHGFNGETGGSFMIDPLDPTLDSDILEVTGSANLDGLLEVALNGIDPAPFAFYDVLVADDITIGDNFDIDGVSIFRVINDPTDPTRQILQVAVPEPGSIAIWCLLGLVALVGSRGWWRRRAM